MRGYEGDNCAMVAQTSPWGGEGLRIGLHQDYYKHVTIDVIL